MSESVPQSKIRDDATAAETAETALGDDGS